MTEKAKRLEARGAFLVCLGSLAFWGSNKLRAGSSALALTLSIVGLGSIIWGALCISRVLTPHRGDK